RNQINEIHRAVFRFERKLDERGKDFRPELLKIQSMLVTLEKDSGIVLTKPAQTVSAESRRKEKEKEAFAGLVDQWGRVFQHAKNDSRVQDDVEWVNAQLRSLNERFKRG